MASTKQRLVDGPEEDHPTRDEVAKYLRMELTTLKRLIEAGDFPRPYQFSPGVWVWDWLDVKAWAHLRAIRHRFRAKRDKKGQPRSNRGSTAVQSGATAKRDRPDP